MIRQVAIGLHDGGNVVMQADGPEKAIPFNGLGVFLCMPTDDGGSKPVDAEFVSPNRMLEGRHTLKKTPFTETAYAADWSRILIEGWKKTPKRPHYYECYVWQTALLCSCMNALLRGEKAVLAHCAVLETDRGAVVIFGESGVGKSTASARWRANGGKCVSDDMALLDFTGDDGEVFVRRMPTWSACREGKNEWNYLAGEELPLTGVFALGRSESGRDEIVGLSPAQFFAQCYRSMFYWNLFYAKDLPDHLKARLTEHILKMTEIITGRFAPRALLTVLDGNLKRLIEESL